MIENNGTLEYLQHPSIGRLLHEYTQHGLNTKQMEAAPEAMVSKILKGENDLQQLYYHFSNLFWRGKADSHLDIFANEFDYLQHMQHITPIKYRRELAELVKELEREGRAQHQAAQLRVRMPKRERNVALYKAARLRMYSSIDKKASKKERDDQLIRYLEQRPLFIEVASLNNQGNGKSPLWSIAVRRKDSERGVQKYATRMLRKDPDFIINDWLGIKLIAYEEEYARGDLIDKIYSQARKIGFEIVEVDNKYARNNNNRLIQLKVKFEGDSDEHLREIAVTDLRSAAIAEADHALYEQSRESENRELLQNRNNKREYNRTVRAGRKLFDVLPPKRRLILGEGLFPS